MKRMKAMKKNFKITSTGSQREVRRRRAVPAGPKGRTIDEPSPGDDGPRKSD